MKKLKTKKPLIAFVDSSPTRKFARTTIASMVTGHNVDPFQAPVDELEEVYATLVARRQDTIIGVLEEALKDPIKENDNVKYSCIVKNDQDWRAIDNIIISIFSEYITRVSERTNYMKSVIVAALDATGAELHPHNKIELEVMGSALTSLRLIMLKHFSLLQEHGRDNQAMKHIPAIREFVAAYIKEAIPKEEHGKRQAEKDARAAHRRDVRSRSKDKKGGVQDKGSEACSSEVGTKAAAKVRERIH